jgi:hypothetical protein
MLARSKLAPAVDVDGRHSISYEPLWQAAAAPQVSILDTKTGARTRDMAAADLCPLTSS